MKSVLWKSRPALRVFMIIFVSFFLTSSVYLSWVYHIIAFVPSETADALTMVAGYFCQAVGIVLILFLTRKKDFRISCPAFLILLILYAVCMIPSLLSTGFAGTLVFGLITNLLCGMVAAYYLQELTFSGDPKRRGLIFGCGYSAASIVTWLLSLTTARNALKEKWILIVYLAIAAVLGILIRWTYDQGNETESIKGNEKCRGKVTGKKSGKRTEKGTEKENRKGSQNRSSSLQDIEFGSTNAALHRLLLLACTTVFLMSLVKNLGFNFPSSDLAGGVSLELSRVFYATGLIIAGLVSDRNRRYGAACAFASMIIPFVCLALSGEPVSSMIFWCLDYFIYAFIAVYRIVLFSDFARNRNMLFLAAFGLLFGRLGDAAGTGICMLLPDNTTILVIVSASIFLPVVFLFFRLYRKLYAASFTEQDHFDNFASAHDLSMRERTILRMILKEQTNAQIAESLYLSESTIKFHIHNLLQKTACRNRKELLNRYAEMKK